MPHEPADVPDPVSAQSSDLQLFIDSIPGLIFTCTPDGKTEVVNRELREYCGRTLDELQAWETSDIVHPEDIERVTHAWRENIAAGAPHAYEERLRRADGVYRWFQLRCSPFLDASGRVVRWYGRLTDIDALKQAEHASRGELRSLSLLIDSIPGLVFTTRPNGEVEWVNRTILAYFGRSLQDLQTWQMTDAVHPDDLPNTIALWREGALSGQPYEFEQRLRRHDGVYRWFHYRAAPLRDEQGQLIRWYGLVTDIDDLKRAHAALRNVQARFSRAAHFATISELAASIAHEVNQPLAAVVATAHACLRWLSAYPPNIDRARLSAEKIVRDGNSAAEVVSRIRSLFKHVPPAKQLLNVNEVIQEVCGLMADDMSNQNVLLRTDLQHELPLVAADRVQLQQLLANLIRNGIEAMDEVNDRPRELSISSRQRQDEVAVTVSDCGVGIDSPDSVFEPFYTTKRNGMGMGLAICRTIVEAHEGRIWTLPNTPHGTTFSFALRVRRAE